MITSSPDAVKPPSPLKILLMGEPGSRKTTLGLQFPDVHVIDCDRNLDGPTRFLMNGLPAVTEKDFRGRETIIKPEVPALLPQLSYTYDNIRVDDQGKMLDITDCYDRVVEKLSCFAHEESYKKRRTVFIDSLSHINEFIIRIVLKKAAKSSMQINLWTDFASYAYTILCAKMEQTGKTVLCSCHLEKISESDDQNIMKKKVIEVNPLFSGRVGDSLGAFFTDVWWLEKRPGLSGGPTQLWLQTDRTEKCSHLKNSVGMPPELNITEGFKVIEPYLKGKI